MVKVLDNGIAGITGFLAEAGLLFNNHMGRSKWRDTEGLLVGGYLVLRSGVVYVQLSLVRAGISQFYARWPSTCQVPTFLAELASLKAQA